MYDRHYDLQEQIMELTALHTKAVDTGNLELVKYYEMLHKEATKKLDKLEKELGLWLDTMIWTAF